MPRNIYYRDFTLAKAAALCGLMGLAVVLGAGKSELHADAERPETEELGGLHVLPVYVIHDADCAGGKSGEQVGVSL